MLGVDFGLKRTGLAVSDPECRLAVGAGWIEGLSGRALVRAVQAAAGERNILRIVIGTPPGRGRDAELVVRGAADLAESLEKRGLQVSRWDESFSTAAVLSDMRRVGASGRSKKGQIDEAAAVIILQGFLDHVKGEALSIESQKYQE